MGVVLAPKEDYKKYQATDLEELGYRGYGAAGQAASSPL